MKKIIFVISIVALFFLAGCAEKETIDQGTDQGDGQLIGGQKDEHGCLVAAGYSWCDTKQECIRSWEEPCKEASELSACVKDSDCIPVPNECHPMECVNKKYEGDYVKPEACTMMFSYEAAYSPDDCACRDNVCVNKNKGRAGEEPQVDTVVDTFEECVAAGNPVMESYPRQCRHEGKNFVEDISEEARHVCTEEESLNTACTKEYRPVCGEIGLNMGKTIYKTFGNGCDACASMKVVAYTPGECAPDKTSDICFNQKGDYMTLTEAADIAKSGECGDDLVLECACPEGYRKDGDACNPECYYSEPKCLSASFSCEKSCVCNEYTGTYWINLNLKKEGCSPACVVNLETKASEINWRCTGALIPE